MTTKKERLEAIIRRLEDKNTDNKLDQEIIELKKLAEDLEDIKKEEGKTSQSNNDANKFTCLACNGKYELTKLFKTVEWAEFYKNTEFANDKNKEILRFCSQDCYEFLYVPPKEEPKKIKFKCDYCLDQIFGVCTRRRVKVSMPNELGFRRGQAYNLCKSCNKKVGEYNNYDYINDHPWLRDEYPHDDDKEIIEKEFGGKL